MQECGSYCEVCLEAWISRNGCPTAVFGGVWKSGRGRSDYQGRFGGDFGIEKGVFECALDEVEAR